MAEAVELFQENLRRFLHLALFDAMEQEVSKLCGPTHPPIQGTAAHRTGSEKGLVYLDGERWPIVRPPVRDQQSKVPLEVY